jgi:rod shape-determining protein MreC
MRDFFRFLMNSHFFMLFLLLEAIAIFLVVRNNDKATVFISSANAVTGFFNEKLSDVSDYFSLREHNKVLIEENELLKNYISQNRIIPEKFSGQLEDSGYFYQTAIVIKNSVHRPYNVMTLDKGKNHGLKEDMAVISDMGIVGVIANVGNNYSTVVSLLNTKLGVNAKIKRTGYFGTLRWDREDYRYVVLNDIPDHSSLYKGDEVVTGGYSSIFPEGIKIGTVHSFEKEIENSFYTIKVKLSQDFKNLKYVYVVDYHGKDERIHLEDSTQLLYFF